MITKEEYNNFKEANFNVLPISRTVSAPEDTPLSLYSKIADQKNNFLLESVEGGERWAQYSIIGFDCIDTIKVSGNTIETSIAGVTNKFISENPLEAIEELTAQYQAPDIENLPRFHGGYVGFFAYESSQYAESKIAKLPSKGSKFNEHMPDIMLVKAEKLIVFDNSNNTTQIILNVSLQNTSYESACSNLDEIENLICQPTSLEADHFNEITNTFEFKSNFSKEEYVDAVSTIKNYIEEGDVMQVVLAQDFSATFDREPFDLYREAIRGQS